MRCLALLLLLGLLAGCGYRPVGQGAAPPYAGQRLRVELFANRTTEPFLENLLTDRVVAELAAGPLLELVAVGVHPELRLTGQIDSYHSSAVAYGRGDDIAEYRGEMRITVRLVRLADGQVVWRGSLVQNAEYPARLDKRQQEDAEALAVREICERLAKELYVRLADDF